VLLEVADAAHTCHLHACRKADIKPNEVLTQLKLPLTTKNEVFYAFKQSHRRDDDIAIVNAAVRLKFAPPSAADGVWSISEASVAYGGVGPSVVIAQATNRTLKQQPVSSETLQVLMRALLCIVTSSHTAVTKSMFETRPTLCGLRYFSSAHVTSIMYS
jgi:xanthine dehydrogenase iron-sulfur cluster and FAD-binding subunit A